MTQAIVRAKKLVFVQDKHGAFMCSVGDDQFLYWRSPGGSWFWRYKTAGIIAREGMDANDDACVDTLQRIVDARWLAMTEVPDLVWSTGVGITCEGSKTRYTAHLHGWTYTCTDWGSRWQWMCVCDDHSSHFKDGDASSLELAQKACQAMCRASILGGDGGMAK